MKIKLSLMWFESYVVAAIVQHVLWSAYFDRYYFRSKNHRTLGDSKGKMSELWQRASLAYPVECGVLIEIQNLTRKH